MEFLWSILTLLMNGKKALVLALLTALILKVFTFDFIFTNGHSMEPAIEDGKVLVINRLRYGVKLPWQQNFLVRWAGPVVGEVVVFYTPSGELAVKRVTTITENGLFYAVGDNGLTSYDSRSYGFVNVENIVGKVLGY